MKINFCKDRPPKTVGFEELVIGDCFYYKWYPDDIRVKISEEEYFSFVSKIKQFATNTKEFVKVKTELNVYKG